MHPIGQMLIHQAEVRILNESLPRIKKCLDQLSPDQIWFRPNPEMASIGNLVLHIIGNARQWILAGLLGQPDHRDRDAEFSAMNASPGKSLLVLLEEFEADLRQALPSITEDKLQDEYHVQVFRESGVSILVHVIEHASYHTGQIARETKRMRQSDLGFYADLAL